MIRNLKALGLALAAVFALSATTASAASLTAESYPAHIVGESSPGENSVLTAPFGISMECETTIMTAEISAPTENTTVTPSFTGCSFGERDVTVTFNGCDFAYNNLAELATDEFSVKADIACPGSNKIEIHIYNPHEANGVWCTLTMGAQTGKEGAEAIDETANGSISIEGTIENISNQMHGTCSGGLTTTVEDDLDAHVIATATNSETSAADPIDIG